LGVRRAPPPEAENGVAQRDARRRPCAEQAAARAGSRLEQALSLEQAHRLAQRPDGDTEAPAEVVLRPEPVAGVALGDLALELPRDELRARRPRAQQRHPQISSAVSTTRRSLAICSSSVSSFPSTVDEKPHWGDRQ